MSRFFFLFFFFLLGLTFPLQSQTDYRIGSEDVLFVYVYEEPDLSIEVRVSSDGYITYPLLGRVEVSGLTVYELEQKLKELLEEDYLVNPQVNVTIREYGSIYVVGEVSKPGPYPLKPGMTLMTALAHAGGITEEADPDRVRVIRQEAGTNEVIDVPLSEIIEKGHIKKDIPLKPNDVVQISKSISGNIYILGQVNKPGEYPLKGKMTVVEAITLAGGMTKIASPNRTRVIRVNKGIKTVIPVPVSKILKSGNKKKDIVLHSDDVVMIPESFF